MARRGISDVIANVENEKEWNLLTNVFQTWLRNLVWGKRVQFNVFANPNDDPQTPPLMALDFCAPYGGVAG